VGGVIAAQTRKRGRPKGGSRPPLVGPVSEDHPALAAVLTRPVAIVGGSFRTCQFIVKGGRPPQFCDVPVAERGEPYCADHRRLCWIKPRW